MYDVHDESGDTILFRGIFEKKFKRTMSIANGVYLKHRKLDWVGKRDF